MQKLIAILAIFGTSIAAFAGSLKTDLVLLSPISSEAKDGAPVVLQTLGGARCKFFGALQSHIRTDVGVTEKAMSSVMGNKDRSISVTRKECSGVVKVIAFSIPLGHMQPGPDAGTRFSVVQPN